MKSLYCLCQNCTAKWFCPRPPLGCPRCGSEDFLVTRARIPWARDRNSEESHSDLPPVAPRPMEAAATLAAAMRKKNAPLKPDRARAESSSNSTEGGRS
jgi:hypothetical protein